MVSKNRILVKVEGLLTPFHIANDISMRNDNSFGIPCGTGSKKNIQDIRINNLFFDFLYFFKFRFRSMNFFYRNSLKTPRKGIRQFFMRLIRDNHLGGQNVQNSLNPFRRHFHINNGIIISTIGNSKKGSKALRTFIQ